MFAAHQNHDEVVKYLTRHGADLKASSSLGSAIDVATAVGAAPELVEWLEVERSCAKPGCDKYGKNACTGCKLVRYCGRECQRGHWGEHKRECQEHKKNNEAFN